MKPILILMTVSLPDGLSSFQRAKALQRICDCANEAASNIERSIRIVDGQYDKVFEDAHIRLEIEE